MFFLHLFFKLYKVKKYKQLKIYINKEKNININIEKKINNKKIKKINLNTRFIHLLEIKCSRVLKTFGKVGSKIKNKNKIN